MYSYSGIGSIERTLKPSPGICILHARFTQAYVGHIDIDVGHV